jgi:transposase
VSIARWNAKGMRRSTRPYSMGTTQDEPVGPRWGKVEPALLRRRRSHSPWQGRRHVDAALPGILEDASAKLSGALRVLLVQLTLELDHLQMRIDAVDAMINKAAAENEVCRRLVAIPGIGPVTATAVIAAIGNGAAFKKGRGFSAWLGIGPGEYTTGGKQKLLGISKRGNSYLRRLFVQGARAVLQQSAKQSSGLCVAGPTLNSHPQ